MPRSHGDYSGEKSSAALTRNYAMINDETDSRGAFSTIKCGLRYFGGKEKRTFSPKWNPSFFSERNMQIPY